jgi:UDP-N-acetylglucosamine--N-acetylmuramyl-(pentapeptide) pyrophosphoryl-undecaprenol N-acetylglucosamine transferase
VLLAGGGSGGHVFPALALGDELAARGWRVDFVGAADGMEARLVGGRGLPFHPLPARPLVGRGALDRLRALLTLVASTRVARRLVRGLGVAVVVGTGGYVSAPAVLGAALARVPALLVEPNAVPGLANRWLSRWAAGAATAFPGTGDSLACPATLTGVPVRAAFAAVGEPPAQGPTRLLVAGGSQGAEQLNRLLPEALGLLASRGADALPALSVVHQAGAGKEEATRERYAAAGLAADGGSSPAPGRPAVSVVGFLEAMPQAVGDAHLVVSRAGAITTAELCAAGRPALLVPLTLAGGHQLANARALEEAGAAAVLPSSDLTAGELADALGGLLADRGRLAAMATAARAFGRPRAAAAIADRVEALAEVRS